MFKVKEHRIRIDVIHVSAGFEMQRFTVPLIVSRLFRHRVTLEAEAENREADEKYRHTGYALGRGRGIRLVEQSPDPWP